jgi:hypothetical protein
VIALLTIIGADGIVRAYTQSGILPVALAGIAKASSLQPPLVSDGALFERIVPRTIGSAPLLDDWLTQLVDYDDPFQTYRLGRHGQIRAQAYMVP